MALIDIQLASTRFRNRAGQVRHIRSRFGCYPYRLLDGRGVDHLERGVADAVHVPLAVGDSQDPLTNPVPTPSLGPLHLLAQNLGGSLLRRGPYVHGFAHLFSSPGRQHPAVADL
jgi:hypothetical protein